MGQDASLSHDLCGDRLAVLKQLVGTWKGKSSPEMIADNILIFKIDGERLTGMERVFAIRDEGDGSGPKIVKDNFVPHRHTD